MDGTFSTANMQATSGPPTEFRELQELVSTWAFPGRVASVDRWSETETWTSGGVVVIDRYGGFATPPVIHSRSSIQQRIWVEIDGGKQIAIPAPGSVGVAAGHKTVAVSLAFWGLMASQSHAYDRGHATLPAFWIALIGLGIVQLVSGRRLIKRLAALADAHAAHIEDIGRSLLARGPGQGIPTQA